MAQEKIEILFKPKGDKELINAIKQLDIVTKRLNGTTSKYEKELEETVNAQKKLNNQLKKSNRSKLLGVKNNRLLSNSFATLRSKLLLVSFGLGLTTMAFRKLFEATIEQEKVEKRLSHQLGTTNKELLNYASGLQKVTMFGDEAIIGVQGMLAAFTKDEEQIKLATQATLDLAAAKGMDLKTAGDLVSKTLGSSTNALSRYGIEVTGSANSILRLESLTKNISTLFAGEAVSAADTLGGSIEQMTNAFGDTNEAIGKAFAPTMQKLAGFFKETSEAATEFFLTMTEDPMETTIRHIEEAGGSADKLKKSFLEMKKTELAPGVEGLESLSKIQENINGQNDYRVFILGEIGKQQEILKKKGHDINALEKESNRLITLGMFDFNEKAHAAAIASQDEAKALLNLINMYKTQLDLTDQDILAQKESQKLLLEYEAIVARLQNLGQNEDPIFKLTLEDIQAYTEQYSGAIMNVANAYNAQRQAALDSAKASELANANSIKSERRRQKEIDKINEKYAAKQKKLNKEAQRTKRAQTVINTAVSLMEIWADDTLKFPGKVVMSAFVSALGAMQLKTIDAQKYATGGLVGGRRHSQGGTMIEAERGEYVISRRGVDAIGIEALNRINAGQGGGSVNVTFAGNVLSKDFIEDEAIPQIKEAIRRGADIGVG